MICPNCNLPSLETRTLEPALTALGCRTCQGTWMRLSEYRAWSASTAASGGADAGTVVTDELAAPLDATPAPSPSGHVRRCPDCRALLGRYRVGHGASFQVDRCAQCNGTWFDRDEWQTMRSLGLAPRLLDVFSPEWQQAIRRNEQADAQERRFAARFGEEDLAKAREVRDWLSAHPLRGELLAYLELAPVRGHDARTATH